MDDGLQEHVDVGVLTVQETFTCTSTVLTHLSTQAPRPAAAERELTFRYSCTISFLQKNSFEFIAETVFVP